MKHWETKVECVVLWCWGRSGSQKLTFQDCTGRWKADHWATEVGGSAKKPGAIEGLGHSGSMGCGLKWCGDGYRNKTETGEVIACDDGWEPQELLSRPPPTLVLPQQVPLDFPWLPAWQQALPCGLG